MSNARFSILQAVAVSDRRVSDAQFRTLAALGMYADKNGWCYPSLKTLGADLKKSSQAVGRDTIALRKLGYLEVKNRYDAKTKSRHSNLYRLKYDMPDFNVDDTPLSTPEVDSLSTPEVEVNAPINDPINKRVKKEKKMDVLGFMAFSEKLKAENGIDKIEELLCEIEKGLHVNVARSTGNQAVAKRILKDGRPFGKWLTWCISDEWRAAHLYHYADLEKIWRDYPQGFVENEIPQLSNWEAMEAQLVEDSKRLNLVY
jgi:hypothetical protein